MEELWYKNAIFYALDVDVFMDSDGDGIGDFAGVNERLDYLQHLGITVVWLLPCYPTPNRDNGYDITNYYAIDQRYGTLETFLEFLRGAGERGIRVIMDLVVNHTSNEHPWFQAARHDAGSRYRSYYVWTDSPPPVPTDMGTIFPGQEESVWTYDEIAGAYYHHRFYHFEPGLNYANEQVRDEVMRIMDFWLSFGIAGFRVDAASHMVEPKGIEEADRVAPHQVLRDLHSFVAERQAGAVLLGEADVTPQRIADFFGDGDELNILFNFLLNNYLYLALAREEAEPLARVLNLLPVIPHSGHWANFLRNLDEVDLERLTDEERQDVFEAFAPKPRMQIYGRGMRRRLAPLLGGDQARIRMAFSLLFSMPGSPMIVYGDEIGMGDDLSLEGRNAVRTPMQWSARKNAGFSKAAPSKLVRPVISEGRFGFEKVNVESQEEEKESLLNWMRELIHLRRECPEVGWGPVRIIDTEDPWVFSHHSEWKGSSTIFVHNLAGNDQTARLHVRGELANRPEPVFGNAKMSEIEENGLQIELPPYGYLWVRAKGHLAGIDLHIHR